MEKILKYLKKNKIISIILAVLITILAFETVYIGKVRTKLENTKNATYQKAFFDLSSALFNIDTSLNKALITNDIAHLNIISGEILKEAQYARARLFDLPKKDITLTNSQKFLSQVSDYVTMLSYKAGRNIPVTDKEKENLKSLSLYADKLSSSLSELEGKFLSGELDFNNVVSAEPDNNTANGYFKSIEEQFENYPTLIYDGPFSDHISNKNAVMLEGEPEISRETAKKKALKFLDFTDINEIYESSDATGKIEIYGFTAKNKKNENIFVDVTKKGGYIVSYTEGRVINDDKISFEKAVENAKEFLNSKGFKNLKVSFYEKANNEIIINFFPEIDNVLFYPDLIKVKIAADNGSVTGFDMKNYIENHKKRADLSPSISKDKALKSLNPSLEITNFRLCIIPLYSGNEILCYEFGGSFNKKDYLCYVNAKTGNIEKLFLVLKDKNRMLTI